MMTAKEKANELLEKFSNAAGSWIEGRKCAIICCNEVLGYMGSDRGYAFWAEVKDILIKFRDV